MKISSAMLMTAGLGTRLRPFTQVTTKVLLPIMGVPGAQFAVDALVHSEVETIVANIHHDAASAREGLLALSHPGARLQISDESKELLGSAGGIRNALPLLGNAPFFYRAADVLCDFDLTTLAARHQQYRSRWGVLLTLAVFPCGPAGASYREINFDFNSGLITSLGEVIPRRPFFTGVAVLEPEIFEGVPKTGPADFVRDLLLPAIQKNKAAAALTSGDWYDYGTPSAWLDTHLTFIHRLETGGFRNPRARLWRRRVESASSRISERTWVANGTRLGGCRTSEWASPCFWSPQSEGGPPPRSLGPETVLYGWTRDGEATRKGIGYGGIWLDIP